MQDDLDIFAHGLLKARKPDTCFVLGLTGSVASGKTTLSQRLVGALGEAADVVAASTDGFLFDNAALEARSLIDRKGFPESYNRDLWAACVSQVRKGPAAFPVYSHDIFDIDPTITQPLDKPDILVLEGLGFTPPERPRPVHAPDVLVYLDAPEDLLVTWYVERFHRLWLAAHNDPESFYARFLHMSESELKAFAVSVWEQINLPNLREHIAPMKQVADVVLVKDAAHHIHINEDRRS